MKLKKLVGCVAALAAMSAATIGTADAATKTTKKKAAPKTTKRGTKTTVKPWQTTGAGQSKLLWDNGACDTKKDPYKVGITTVFTSPVLSLVDQVNALEASVAAFNKRGGIKGHCMALTTCDGKVDPNAEVACARKFVDDGIVATLNDTIVANAGGYTDIMLANKLPMFEVSPGQAQMGSQYIPVVTAIGAGGTGTSFMMVAHCLKAGHTKIGIVHVDSPAFASFAPAAGSMLKAYGAEIVATNPVPGGTTDYQQFTLAMEKAGATCVTLPLGETEAKQVLRAAQQLGTKIQFAASLGTFAFADTASYGEFIGNFLLNAEIPPATMTDQFPIYKDAVVDLEASGKAELKKEQIKSSPMRSWIAAYHFVRVIEDFGTPDVISRDAVNAAISKAKDVQTGGLIPTWTPTARVLPEGHPFQKAFGTISQPWYYQIKFDTKAKNWVVAPEKMHFNNELAGVNKYDQPK